MENTKQFKSGSVYGGTHICDSDLTSYYLIVSRTAKTVTVKQVAVNNTELSSQPVIRRGVKVWSGVECFLPDGNYSMALSIHADREKIQEKAA